MPIKDDLRINAGVMVMRPSAKDFNKMLQHINDDTAPAEHPKSGILPLPMPWLAAVILIWLIAALRFFEFHYENSSLL